MGLACWLGPLGMLIGLFPQSQSQTQRARQSGRKLMDRRVRPHYELRHRRPRSNHVTSSALPLPVSAIGSLPNTHSHTFPPPGTSETCRIPCFGIAQHMPHQGGGACSAEHGCPTPHPTPPSAIVVPTYTRTFTARGVPALSNRGVVFRGMQHHFTPPL